MATMNGIDKPLQTNIPQAALDDMMKPPMEVEVQMMDDDGMPEEEPEEENTLSQMPHDANLAEGMPITDLIKIATDVIAMFDADVQARSDWERAYTKGLDLLGMKIEARSKPWPGASGVFHPVLAEAVVRFQAQTMLECWPAAGPSMPSIKGRNVPEKMKRAKRVSDEVNLFCTDLMPEYRSETEQMLFRLPLAGSAFKKVYKDPIANRPVSMFIPAEDFVAPYGCSNLTQCERYTHLLRRSTNELKRDMLTGFYKHYEVHTPTPRFSQIEEKTSKITGHRPTIEYDDRHQVLEMHVNIIVPGLDDEDDYAKPYVVTVLKDDSKVLAIRRNWKPDDPAFTRQPYFVHYPYLPGMGLYGTGLIHLVGGLASSATSILRQLIDAGTLSNLPSGFKARGLRIKAEDKNPLEPGEFRDIDVPGNAIRDSLYPIPAKEPSAVLYQLLGNVVDEARRIGSVADLKITDMSSDAPVGTTLALLERSLKVMSGVQARIHAALKQELSMIYDIIGTLEGNYEYDVDEGADRRTDFAEKFACVPVSDPNASTMAQRVVQYQAAMEFSARSPDIYNLPKLHSQMLNVLGIKDADEIVKMPQDLPLTDPVSENMAILTMQPVKAFLQQDHQAHIQVHMNMAQDPKIQEMVGQSPNANAVMASMSAHIAEHMAFQYRTQIEQLTGASLPPPGQQLPDDVEANLSRLVAAASGKLLDQSKSQIAQQKAQEAMQDPMVQIELQKLDNAKDEITRKKAKDAIDAILKIRELVGRDQIDTARIAADILTKMHGVTAQDAKASGNATMELLRMATQAAQHREQQNTARDTAKTQHVTAVVTEGLRGKHALQVAKARPKPNGKS